MKTLAKIFNSLTVCTMSGIGCVPMAANFSTNSNKSFSITAKHNSLTTQQLKDESGIDVDDYQSMIQKYINEHDQDLDDMAKTLNKGTTVVPMFEVFDNLEWASWFSILHLSSWGLAKVHYLNHKSPFNLTFTSKPEKFEYTLYKSITEDVDSSYFDISIDKPIHAHEDRKSASAWNPEDSIKSDKFYWEFNKNIPSDCFSVSNNKIYFNPNNENYYQTYGFADSYYAVAYAYVNGTGSIDPLGTGSAQLFDINPWKITAELQNSQEKTALFSPFAYDPTQLFQFDKVGLDKNNGKIYSQSSLNKHLLKVALSTEFNQDFIDPNNNWNTPWLDIEFSGTSTIIKDGKIVPNPSTLIHLENTQYWGDMLGQKDPVAGGLDLWFPIGNGYLDAGKYGNYDNQGYLLKCNEILTLLKKLAKPEHLSDGKYSMILTYDNYFKLRDWCKQYCFDNHDFPDEQKIKDGLLSSDLTNNDWVKWINESTTGTPEWLLNAGDDSAPIYVNPKNTDYLEQLAITLKAIKFDEWNNYDSTGQGNLAGNWDNPLENQYVNDNKNVSYDQIANGFNKKYYDNVPVDKNTPIIVTTNMRSMMPGQDDTSGIEGIGVQTNENYIDDTHTYSLSNDNNIDSLSKLTGGKISKVDVTFPYNSETVTTTGISVSQKARMAKAYDDKELANKIQVQIRCYDDFIGKNFYDESKPTKNFNARAYELDKHDPNNQPYELKSASEIYNIAKSHANEDSDEAILKNMFYDYKNNCPATPIVDVNLYDNEDFDYDVEQTISNLKLSHAINDAEGKIKIFVTDTSDPKYKSCEATFGGFQQSITPIPQPNGITPNTVGIVAGSVLGTVAITGITWYIVWNRRRSTKRLHPDIKKLKREGSYEE